MKHSLRLALLLALYSVGLAQEALAQGAEAELLAPRPALTLEAAKVVAAAAEAEALSNGWQVVLAITDAGGHLVYLQRMDGVQLGSLEIAQQKARTAALFRRPTKVFADRLAEGNQAMLDLPDAIPLEGGLPIVIEGQVIGAVGVSGVRADQDAQIAEAGIAALLARLEE